MLARALAGRKPDSVDADMGFVSKSLAPEPFAARPWTALSKEILGGAARVPSMLSEAERLLYLWLTETWARGDGTVVELGAFAGGSTACLAEGIRRAKRSQTIFAYDRFEASQTAKDEILYKAGIDPFEGNDILPLATRLLSPWKDLVTFVPGDIEDAEWDQGPIEILVIDAAKSARAADQIAETFFPHLIPGRSVVVHQDFLHWKLPWLPAQMEWMAECFSPVAHCPRDTVVFLCEKTPNPGDLAHGRVRGRHDTDLADALAAANLRLRDWDLDQKFAAQFRALSRNPRTRQAKSFDRRP